MSKIKEKMSLSFEGTLDLDDMSVEIENFEEPIMLESLLKNYNGRFVKVNVSVIDSIPEK